MNTSMLETLSDSVGETFDRHQDAFKKIIVIDTDDSNERSVNANLLSQILDCFESFLNPEILVVPKQDMEDLLSNASCAFTPDSETYRIWKIIEKKGQYRRVP